MFSGLRSTAEEIEKCEERIRLLKEAYMKMPQSEIDRIDVEA